MKRLALYLALGASFSACKPTSPTDEPELAFAFVNATPQQQEAALSLWLEQRACTGLHMRESKAVSVEVLSGAFLCVGSTTATWAAGCAQFGKITVGAPWFENAISHEFIHYVSLLDGKDGDPEHTSGMWEKCDKRNLK